MTAPAGSQQSQSLGLVRKISYLLSFCYFKTIIRNALVEIIYTNLKQKINTVAYTLFILFLASRMAINRLLDLLHHFGMGILWIHRLG